MKLASIRGAIVKLAMLVVLLLTWVAAAHADNCSDLTDCYGTMTAAVPAAVGVAVLVAVALASRLLDEPKKHTIALCGTVVRLDGQPAAGISVTLGNEDRKYTVSTNKDGSYMFDGIEPGSYVLTIDAPGYRYVEDKVVIDALNAVEP